MHRPWVRIALAIATVVSSGLLIGAAVLAAVLLLESIIKRATGP